MPVYIYNAKSGPEKTVTGEVEAPSEEQALVRIEKMGLVPVKISMKVDAHPGVSGASEAFTPRGVKAETAPQIARASAKSVKVKSRDLDTFTRQLASLVKSSVPMLQALALLAKQTESKSLKGVVGALWTNVKDGKTVSEAMADYPGVFNNMYLNMVRSGERSGTLDQVLYRLAEHREREHDLKQKIQAALAYPVLVMIVGAGTIFVMLTYFLPKLTVIFKGMKQELPLPTKILMGLTGFMSKYWYMFLIAVVLGLLIFGRVKKGSRKKLLFDTFVLKIPFIKKFTLDAETGRFARSLGILMKNGLSVHESLELAADTLDNEAMKGALKSAGQSIVEQGLSLSESFTKTGIFPEFTINMISVGEQGGKVTEALEEIANVYEREVDQSIKIMTSLLEPILILTVGAIVGFIVFAMLLPIFNIGVGGR